MGTEYIGEQHRKLYDNRQGIFGNLIDYLTANNIKHIVAFKTGDIINTVEITLEGNKTYVFTVEVVKKGNDFVNYFTTSELIAIPADYPKFALAHVYILDILNDIANDSSFMQNMRLPRSGTLGRVVLKETTLINDFATDYMYQLKKVANDSLEKMYSIDTVKTFLETQGYTHTKGFDWECDGSPNAYLPVMSGEYFSGKQIKTFLPAALFEIFTRDTPNL